MISDTILDAIGQTPLVRLNRIGQDSDRAEILVKFEGVNIGGSIKTRTAYAMPNFSQSQIAVPILIAVGCVPSTTCKFSLSEVGGHEEPGQCQTSVFKPFSAKTFHNGSA